MLKILVKYPTRQRPELFLKTLKAYIDKASDNSNIDYLISYDVDDESMSTEVINNALILHPNVFCKKGLSDSKIHACNRDVNEFHKPWDIILLISDDMHVQVEEWDNVIREKMEKHYPDTDGCLWFHDGSKQKVISTLSCIGKKYYERFGWIYNPKYKSFFCDNEYTDVARSLNKITFIDKVIIKHEHPQWGGGVKHDALYERNNGPWEHDGNLYRSRQFKSQIA